MNQGNVGQFIKDDGVFQDGGLFVHFPDQQEWVAAFLRFQSQAWHTDDTTGHTIPGSGPTDPRACRRAKSRTASFASSPRW